MTDANQPSVGEGVSHSNKKVVKKGEPARTLLCEMRKLRHRSDLKVGGELSDWDPFGVI